MITGNSPIKLPEAAPAIVHELRAAFDARMMDLGQQAAAIQPAPPTEGVDRTVHLHFEHDALQVTAVFNSMSGEFTQLIARDPTESGSERPSFTISLFL